MSELHDAMVALVEGRSLTDADAEKPDVAPQVVSLDAFRRRTPSKE